MANIPVAVSWPTVLVSLAAALVVAVVSYLLTERSNVRTFRREQFYKTKLETYLEIVHATDTLVDALENLLQIYPDQIRNHFNDVLRSAGASAQDAAAFRGMIEAQMLPLFRSFEWDALEPDEIRAQSSSRGVPTPPMGAAGGGPPGDEALLLNFTRFLGIAARAGRRLNSAHARLVLLQVPDSTKNALKSMGRRFTEIGQENFPALLGAPLATREQLVEELRTKLSSLAKEFADDLNATMN